MRDASGDIVAIFSFQRKPEITKGHIFQTSPPPVLLGIARICFLFLCLSSSCPLSFIFISSFLPLSFLLFCLCLSFCFPCSFLFHVSGFPVLFLVFFAYCLSFLDCSLFLFSPFLSLPFLSLILFPRFHFLSSFPFPSSSFFFAFSLPFLLFALDNFFLLFSQVHNHVL